MRSKLVGLAVRTSLTPDGADIKLDGLEMYFAADGSFLGQSKKGDTEIRIATKYTPYKANKNGKIDEGFLISK